MRHSTLSMLENVAFFYSFFFFQKNKNKSEKKADQLDFANSFTDLKENWQFQFTLVLYTFEN